MTDPNNYRFLIEYDGTDFAGWQRQGKGERTVQGVLEAALAQVLQEPVTLIGAGRTDSGVHAEGMVASALLTPPTMPLDQLRKAINSMSGGDVQIIELVEAPLGFSARFSAVSRSYRYRLERVHHPLRRRTSWTPQFDWDDAKIIEAVALLTGKHCFRSFCLERPLEKDYISHILSATWEVDDEMSVGRGSAPVHGGATFRISADRFLHKMVRALVAALYDVGRGYYTVDDFRRLLDEPAPNPALRVAPACGLTLVSVGY